MSHKHRHRHTEQDPSFVAPEEVINDIRCQGFGVVARLGACILLLTDGMSVQAFTNKESIVYQFADRYEELLEESPEITRQEWDDLHLIMIHLPKEEAAFDLFTDPVLKYSQVQGSTRITGIAGIPVKDNILTLKALDLHDDVLAEVDMEVQEEEAAEVAEGDVPLL